jgi:hypothetical protein
MEEQWLVDRAHLSQLMNEHSDWKHHQYATATQRSIAWVKKWRRRIEQARGNDGVLIGQSRRRKTPQGEWKAAVVQRIVDIREHPPEGLGRVPGPVAILYYLQRDEGLLAEGLSLPKGAPTIWRILHHAGCYLPVRKVEHTPVERPAPLQSWEMDFKDVSRVPPKPEGKKMHSVETLNVVDEGTSILVAAKPHPEYNAETTLGAVAEVLGDWGCPQSIRLDRDPRHVGSEQGSDFPSALLRFLLCLGIQPIICPPQRPDKNPFVERYHRSYDSECLKRLLPHNLEETETVTRTYYQHYNYQRPNQAISCGNRPPRTAYPDLPTLPALPEQVTPNAWLSAYHGHLFKRRITYNGSIQVGKQLYYVQKALKGRYGVVKVDAQPQKFEVYLNKVHIKSLPIKGLHVDATIPFDEFLALSLCEARSEWQHYLNNLRKRRAQPATMC